MGVVIEQRGDRLLLRATLPARPGVNHSLSHQRRLSLGVHANPAGLKEAEAEARKIGSQLERDEFDWIPYIKTSTATPQSCQQWIERYKAHYLAEGGTVATWDGDYWKVYRHLPLLLAANAG